MLNYEDSVDVLFIYKNNFLMSFWNEFLKWVFEMSFWNEFLKCINELFRDANLTWGLYVK